MPYCILPAYIRIQWGWLILWCRQCSCRLLNILFTHTYLRLRNGDASRCYFRFHRYGRKGAFGVALCNIVTGLPAIISVISIMIYSASFMFSWGPICWVLIAEIFPNTIRGAAVAIAVAFQWIFNFIVSSTFLPMYNMRLGKWEISSATCSPMLFMALSA